MALEQVLYNVSGSTNLASIGVDDLSHIVSEYPYFAPAQFLLALKQKEQSSYSFNNQIQKAALHFSNPLWLQYQLHNGLIAEPILEKIVLHSKLQQPIVSPVTIVAPVVNVLATTVTSEIPVIATTTPSVDTVVKEAVIEQTPAIIAEPEPITPIAPIVETVINNGIIDYSSFALSNSLKDTPAVVSQQPIITQPAAPITQPSTPPDFSNNASFAIPTLEAVKRLLDVNTGNNNNVDLSKNTGSTIPAYTFNGFADTNPLAPNAVGLSEAYNEEEEIAVLDEEEEKNHTNNISAVLSNQMADFKKPITEETKLEFESEPLFKVDYFASQGIKIDLTKQPQDKLTLQLRRFTDWLKQIKGQSPNPQDLGTDPELEKAIANIAKASIAAREIVTETMADVFIKQGKVDKAIQLYIKLSFLDPQKSAYFASKIQQLKGI